MVNVQGRESMEIRLLAAPVEVLCSSEVNGYSTSLIRTNYPSPANQAIARIDTYPDADNILSASASADGSFRFFAVPNSQGGRESERDAFSGQMFGGWNSPPTHHAIAQYLLYACLAASMMHGHLLNVYA